jgi:uncharacterized protein (TIGR03435 family)
VWWLGARIVAEREQACDEHVTRSGHAPGAYAEGILNVCQHYLESKLPLVSGVSGADLRQRIERVIRGTPVMTVSAMKKWILAAAGCAALVVPIAMGFLGLASAGTATTAPFEAVIIRTTPAGTTRAFLTLQDQFGGGIEVGNLTLRQLIAYAYRVDESRVSGPAWLSSTHFDIRAANTVRLDMTIAPIPRNAIEADREKLKALLASRFGVVARRSSSTMTGFALRVSNEGSKLKPAAFGFDTRFEFLPNSIHSRGIATTQLAEQLAMHLGAPVVDETNLADAFTIDLAWGAETDHSGARPPAVPLTVDTLERALRQQLGLTLEPRSLTLESIEVASAKQPQDAVVAELGALQSVTIRLAAQGANGMGIGILPGGGFVLRNGSLRNVIATAYGINDRLITGSEWLDEPRLDVYVKRAPTWSMPTSFTDPKLQTLLEERFGLVVVRSHPDMDGYVLKVAPGGFKLAPVSPNILPGIGFGTNFVDGKASTIEWLTTSASGMLHVPVVDETGLGGHYDIHLEWGPTAPKYDPKLAVPVTVERLQQAFAKIGLTLEPRRLKGDQLTVVSVTPPAEVAARAL